jgi:predicted esterase
MTLSRRPARAAACMLAVTFGCAPAAPPCPPAAQPRITVVDRAPEGGLRYRLHLAEGATAERPHRLIIWLHPSGASLDGRVEPLASCFAACGFALMVFPAKQHRSWLGSEANQLMNRTLPDAGRIAGVDARRPILMGFSAGAQMALHLWAAAPARFGGLVLDGAAPLFWDGGRMAARPLPQSPALRDTPVLVLVGGEDPAAALWAEAAPAWSSQGIPLTVRAFPGEGHAPLFDGAARCDLYAWIEGAIGARQARARCWICAAR